MHKSQVFNTNETIDNIGPFKIIQRKDGYRFSENAVHLADFVLPLSKDDTVLDIGAGSGIIPLILAYKTDCKKLFAVELQDSLKELANRNITFNNLAKRVKIIWTDYRRLREFFNDGQFSVIVSNPPHTRAGTGRNCPNPERAIARHEVFGALKELVNISRHLLRRNGRAAYIYPLSRMKEVVSAVTDEGLEITRIKFVGLKRFLIEARKR